ncbi:MAG TPA: CoA transferase [Dehalococcoidia bacterium]|nr:CoA transferase [Dehalococcoidia bacterium]
MADKVVSLSEAARLISDGATLGTVGAVDCAPVTLFKELIRQQRTGLHAIHVPSGGWAADLLIGGGVTATVETGAVTQGEAGSAPNFRRATQGGEIHALDST